MDVEFLRYEFENGYSVVVIKNGFSIGVRYIQMAYMFAAAVVMGMVRGGIGIAVLAMNDETRQNDTYILIHTWDMRIQGAILSSFFFGYALMMVPAELFFKKLSSRIVFTLMLGINGAICVAMPTIANKGGWVAVCNAMLVMGTAHAGFSCVNQKLLENWLPPNEKRPFSFIIYGGIQLGIIISMPLSGLFSQQPLGWELVYYALAMVTLAMTIVYGILTASSPGDHQAMGDKEKEYIEEALNYYKKKSIKKPMKKILKSPQFWALASAHAASNAVFVFYLVDVPAYFKLFGLSLNDCSLFSMLPFIVMWSVYLLTAPTLGWISNLRLISYLFNITNFRKLVNGLGALGIVIGLTILSNLSPQWRNTALLITTATLGLLGFQFSGFLSSYKDMTENHAGTLIAMGCTFSSFVAAVVPFITGSIIGDDFRNVNRWRSVFLALSSIYLLSNIVYTFFGSNERQPWDRTRVKSFAHYSKMTHTNQVQLEEFSQPDLIPERQENDTAF